MDHLVQQSGHYVLPPRLDLRQELQRSRQEGSAASCKLSAKKGEPWTEEEHVAFLQGLHNLGKGQWKQISRLYVPTRTPTQVASHAQKHFLRVSGSTKRRSRFSAVEEASAASAPGTSLLLPSLPHHLSPSRPLEALGHPCTGVSLGVPVSQPAWLPPPVKQLSPNLPIFPVGPSRPAGTPPAHQGNASPRSSGDSKPLSPGSLSPDARSKQSQQQQRCGASPAAVAEPVQRHTPGPGPGSRQQQLLRLLEMREQLKVQEEVVPPPQHPALPQHHPHLTPLLPVAPALHRTQHPSLPRPCPTSSAGSGSAATSQQGQHGPLPSASSAGSPACLGAGPAVAELSRPAHAGVAGRLQAPEVQGVASLKIEPAADSVGEPQVQPLRGKLRRLGGGRAVPGSDPGGLAMLAAAAAYSDAGCAGDAGDGVGCAAELCAEADSDADTTLGHAHGSRTV